MQKAYHLLSEFDALDLIVDVPAGIVTEKSSVYLLSLC